MWWPFLAFTVIIPFCVWMGAVSNRDIAKFASRWQAHDIGYDGLTWKHKPNCPCGKGGYLINGSTQPR